MSTRAAGLPLRPQDSSCEDLTQPTAGRGQTLDMLIGTPSGWSSTAQLGQRQPTLSSPPALAGGCGHSAPVGQTFPGPVPDQKVPAIALLAHMKSTQVPVPSGPGRVGTTAPLPSPLL